MSYNHKVGQHGEASFSLADSKRIAWEELTETNFEDQMMAQGNPSWESEHLREQCPKRVGSK